MMNQKPIPPSPGRDQIEEITGVVLAVLSAQKDVRQPGSADYSQAGELEQDAEDKFSRQTDEPPGRNG